MGIPNSLSYQCVVKSVETCREREGVNIAPFAVLSGGFASHPFTVVTRVQIPPRALSDDDNDDERSEESVVVETVRRDLKQGVKRSGTTGVQIPPRALLYIQQDKRRGSSRRNRCISCAPSGI